LLAAMAQSSRGGFGSMTGISFQLGRTSTRLQPHLLQSMRVILSVPDELRADVREEFGTNGYGSPAPTPIILQKVGCVARP
jgi:hypothetical protein